MELAVGTSAENIRTPLLIIHSDNDLRCPVHQAEDLFTRLRIPGREVELVRFPAEGHEHARTGSPLRRAKRIEIILDWPHQHLKNPTSAGRPGDWCRPLGRTATIVPEALRPQPADQLRSDRIVPGAR